MTAERSCGVCSLCCTVLRVDELAKLGGRPCLHQRGEGGCAVHTKRPGVCRAYRCAWLGGAFGEEDRPDQLGAVLDLVPRGPVIHLVVRQAQEDAFEASPRLRAIVDEARATMPVELRDVADVLDADRSYRILHPGGVEHRIAGDRLEVIREGQLVERRRAPLLERGIHRIVDWWQRRRLARWPEHAERLESLGLPARSSDTLPASRDEVPPEEDSR